MEAGPLNKRVTLQQPVEQRGADYADVQVVWQDVATVWAAIEPLSGSEFLRNQEVQSDLSVRVRVRWQAALALVTPKWRVVFGTRVFGIDGVINPREANVEIELACTESIGG